MNNSKRMPIMILAWMCAAAGLVCAQTYHLGEQGWQSLEQMPEGEYMLAVAKAKEQIMAGDADAVNTLEQLKADFPDLAGREIENYLRAERLYAKRSWQKAAADYRKFLRRWPDSSLRPAALERLYSIATAYLQGQRRRVLWIVPVSAFDDGIRLMHDIADLTGNAPIAIRALTTLAEAQEQRRFYFDAFQTWSEIADRQPTGPVGQQALYRMARALHASYRGPQYDASVLRSAQSYYEDFQSRYPDEAARRGVDRTLELISEQMAFKEYQVGFYYERTSSVDAGWMYYNKVLEEWPDTKGAQMTQMRMSPDAPPAVEPSVRRTLFTLSTGFLDTWFGVQQAVDYFLPEDAADEQTEMTF